MKRYDFTHTGPVYIISDDWFEVAYYARDHKKYKRIRIVGLQTWEQTREQEIDGDTFWMTVACIERSKRHAKK